MCKSSFSSGAASSLTSANCCYQWASLLSCQSQKLIDCSTPTSNSNVGNVWVEGVLDAAQPINKHLV